MPIMFIMQGISGSGKSTRARDIARARSADIYSTDDFPGLYGPDGSFNVSLLGSAHAWCLRSVVGALMQGGNVVVDNTNTTVAEMAPYVALAQAFGYEPRIVRMRCDATTAHARNVHGVPLTAVKRQALNLDRFEIPSHWNFIPGFTITEEM